MVQACQIGNPGDPTKAVILDFRPDGIVGAGPDAWKARLDVTQLATESGKRAEQ